MKAEVERWLSACIVAGHDMPYGDNSHVSFEVEAPTLEALCRAWLALDKSVPGTVTIAGTDPESGQPRMIIRTTEAALSDAPPLIYQRVRVVVEDSHG